MNNKSSNINNNYTLKKRAGRLGSLSFESSKLEFKVVRMYKIYIKKKK